MPRIVPTVNVVLMQRLRDAAVGVNQIDDLQTRIPRYCVKILVYRGERVVVKTTSFLEHRVNGEDDRNYVRLRKITELSQVIDDFFSVGAVQ